MTMTAKTTYLIEKQIVEFASVKNKALFTLISQMIVATMATLKVSYEDLTNPNEQRKREAAEARHILMLLIYNETPESKMSRLVVAQLFGYTSAMTQHKARKKYEKFFRFRKKYNAVKKRYKAIALIEYDYQIPF